MIDHATLHHTVLTHIIEHGFAPEVERLSYLLDETIESVTKALFELQEYRGVVLHSNTPKIWVMHPFSLAPTSFWVQSKRGSWWGNCAWCSLGIAALLKEDIVITTSLGAHGKHIEVEVVDGKLVQEEFLVHFPVPMKKAWDNVIYTCSTMLIFDKHSEIDVWCKQHDIPKGDVQPIAKIWELSQKWYGDHLNPNWKRWTKIQAKEIFDAFGLTHKVWNVEASGSTF